MDTLVDHFRRDMRIAPRYCVRADLRVRIWKSEIPEQHAESINLSEHGIFFVTDAVFQRGEAVEVFFKMPQEVTGEPPTQWRCTGLVVRVERVDSPTGKLGVGVRFRLLRGCPIKSGRFAGQHVSTKPLWLRNRGGPCKNEPSSLMTSSPTANSSSVCWSPQA
jgi:PilZ domain